MMMSPNKRIFLNFAATYGRTLYTIAVGIFCGRWTFMALGEVDYGLMGVVGGLIVFMSFFNSLLSSAVARFFAYSVGEAGDRGDAGLEECRRWFNVALIMYLSAAALLLAVAYPAGEFAVRRFLTIPPDRVEDCRWVWRIVCAGYFLTMASVPFNAMYQAKQYIAELTVYSFATTTLNALFLYYAVTHPGVWLVKISLWGLFLGICPQLIIMARSFSLFPECRIIPRYAFDAARMRELLSYGYYRFFGVINTITRRQGLDIVINKMLGPVNNAAMNVAGTVSAHCGNLAAAFITALSPAITVAYGAKDMVRVRKLAFAACKLSAVMVLVFIMPLAIEADEVFRLWLVNPPAGTVEISRVIMLCLVLENATCGLYMPIYADGRIKNSQRASFALGIASLALAVLLMWRGMGLMAAGYSLLANQIGLMLLRLYFARSLCGISARKWISGTAVPLAVATAIPLLAGLAMCFFVKQSFVRVIATAVVANMLFLPFVWRLVFDGEERGFVREKIFAKFCVKF